LLGKVDWFDQISRRSRWTTVRDRFGLIFYRRARLIGSALMIGLLALLLYTMQLDTYRQFAYYNLVTTAFAEAIDKFYSERPAASRRVTLDNTSYDAQVMARLITPDVSFRGYTDLVASLRRPDPEMNNANVAPALPLLHRDWGFEHAARLGLSRAAYETQLISEIDSHACWPDLMFHFSFLECAPYQSDFRNYFPAKMRQSIPLIGDAYQRYLLRLFGKREVLGEALVLSTSQIRDPEVSSAFRQQSVGTQELSIRANGFSPSRTVRVYAYWQSPT